METTNDRSVTELTRNNSVHVNCSTGDEWRVDQPWVTEDTVYNIVESTIYTG